jgi:hypothetical protein
MIQLCKEILHEAIRAVVLLQHRISQMATIDVRFRNNQTWLITAARVLGFVPRIGAVLRTSMSWT